MGSSVRTWLLIVSLAVVVWQSAGASRAGSPVDPQPEAAGIFLQFTGHIAHQIALDKEQFAAAEVCTQWFYQQLKPKRGKPAQPTASETSDCRVKYPEGIDGARDEFSRTQSLLSLSLTFYEFALVGDRNDDGRYSTAELQDILEAFGFTFDEVVPDAILVATLNNKFDSLRKFGGMETLMVSMGTLYDKGYRFTSQDREALDRIMG